ncbi:MAG: ABC transporter ATP-binding protein [Planctomycetota bacterium]|nr:ABC transporter ATP-binding protein [Planctomycetota bacterium]
MTDDGSTLAVEVRGLTRVFGSGESKVEALRGLDMNLSAGDFAAVMGPSGSGKSTLLHLIAGLDAPNSGTIRVAGRDLSTLNDDELTLLRRRNIGFVFQAFNLLNILTAEENVALPLVIGGTSRAEAHSKAAAALDRVGIGQRRKHLPTELSGGEQQRVAVARALVNEPLILLADEPTGNLDSLSSDRIVMLLRRLVEEQGQTILMVTHEARHAAMADRLIHLRDGRVVQEQTLPPGREVDEILQDLESPP